ncbi:MAG: hypothetical protein GF405_11085 [Candidatus Eisenbacteria bacterium]|nr:hypothetical protein [Candidatus Eisenbacteria bacterium]
MMPGDRDVRRASCSGGRSPAFSATRSPSHPRCDMIDSQTCRQRPSRGCIVRRLRPTLCLLGVLLVLASNPFSGTPASAYTAPSSVDIGGGQSGSAQDVFSRAEAIYGPLSEMLDPTEGYPRSITNGSSWMRSSAESWTSGFFSGVLWRLHERTGDHALRTQAERWMNGLAGLTTLPSHDVGFILYSSFGHGYRITGDPSYRDVLLDAADHLATRYDPEVRAIRSWGPMRHLVYPVAIDGMMNIEILFWAAENGGDPGLAGIAWEHARTTMRDHVRGDGTTFHVVDYDPTTGAKLWKGTVQGLADSSTWSRGQAWALYGFTVATRYTNDIAFLWTAEKTADAFLDRLPSGWIPCWDFDAEGIPGEPRDASAAAVAASGLWELASLTDDPERRSRYRAASYAIVERLSGGYYSAEGVGMPALLLHSTGHRPHDAEVDVPIIYAEYYFLEALARQRPLAGRMRRGGRGEKDGPVQIALHASPNPSRGRVRLVCGGPGAGTAELTVYDVAGRLVRRLPLPGGGDDEGHVVIWDGTGEDGRRVASGVYVVRARAGNASVTRTVVLVR